MRSDYRIRPGGALLFDWGASHCGHNADITRTVFVAEVSDTDRAFYGAVRAANAAGRRSDPRRADRARRRRRGTVAARSLAFRRHKTGLDVHEAPHIMRRDATILEAGVVFTVEPGLYRPGYVGMCIEDDVVMTDDGIDCLRAFPRDLRIVSAP